MDSATADSEGQGVGLTTALTGVGEGAKQETCVAAPCLPWQLSIHDRAYRSITTSCRNHSPGANAPRSEPCGFETALYAVS